MRQFFNLYWWVIVFICLTCLNFYDICDKTGLIRTNNANVATAQKENLVSISPEKKIQMTKLTLIV